MDGVDARQIQAIQKLAQADPEIMKMQKMAELKAIVHEHTNRCWERCDIGREARNSSLSKNFKKFQEKI